MADNQDTHARPNINLDDARKFVAALSGSVDAPQTWQTFIDNKDSAGDNAEGKTDHGTLAHFQADLSTLNAAGHGVYVVVNRCDPSIGPPTAKTRRHVIAPRAWFLDSDLGDLGKPFHKVPTMVVRSKSGPHVHWRCAAGTSWREWTDGQRALAMHYRTDPAMINVDRVLRVPGFLHQKNPADPFLVTLEQVNEKAEYTFAQMLPRAVPSTDEWQSYMTWFRATKAAKEHGGKVPDYEEDTWPGLRERAAAWHRAIVAASAHVLRGLTKTPDILGFDPDKDTTFWDSYRDWWLALVEIIDKRTVDGTKLAKFGTPEWEAQHPQVVSWLSACRRHKAAVSKARTAGQPVPTADLRFGASLPEGEVNQVEARRLDTHGAKFGSDGTYDPHELAVITADRKEQTVAEVISKLKAGDTSRIFCPFHSNTKTPAAFIRKTRKGSYVRCDSCGVKYTETTPQPVEADQVEQPADNGANRTFPATDIGNAERLIARYGLDLRWSSALGWFSWDGKRWKRDEGESAVIQKAIATIRSIVDEANSLPFNSQERASLFKWAQVSESAGKVSAMVNLSRHLPGVPVDATKLDEDPWLLNCTNGIVDLRTGDLLPHDRATMCSKVTGIEYDSTAQAPRFERFLDEVFPDKAVKDWVQKHLGYCLTGVVRQHLLPVWWGSGRNGKSTLIDAVSFVMGDYATAIDPTILLDRQGEAHPTERMPLLGARLVFASEPDRKRGLSLAIVKRLTGGDPITARLMRQDTVTWLPTHKLVLLANHRPTVSAQDTDTATWERLRLIPWTQEFTGPRQDPTLPDTLRREAAGILAWLVRGCLAWQREGLTPPDAIQLATDSYRDETDQVARWMADCCVSFEMASAKDPKVKAVEDVKVEAPSLRKSYEQWCETEGIKYPLGGVAWGEQVKRLGGVHPDDNSVPGRKSNGKKYWRGLRLRFQDEEAPALDVMVGQIAWTAPEKSLPAGVAPAFGAVVTWDSLWEDE